MEPAHRGEESLTAKALSPRAHFPVMSDDSTLKAREHPQVRPKGVVHERLTSQALMHHGRPVHQSLW